MRWRRSFVPLIFVPLAFGVLLVGIYYKLWTFHDIVPYVVAGLIGGIPSSIAYGFKSNNKSEGLTFTSTVTTQEHVPSLVYGRIIVRRSEENQRGGTYRHSDYLLQIINTTPNTVARNCQASLDLHNNSDITDFVAFWNKNNSETISIGHLELLKLFTLSRFYKGNRPVGTKLHFYKLSIEGALGYFDITYGENLNRELCVLLQSENTPYPSATEAFCKTIQYIINNAVEE